jgi:hypothetical protein
MLSIKVLAPAVSAQVQKKFAASGDYAFGFMFRDALHSSRKKVCKVPPLVHSFTPELFVVGGITREWNDGCTQLEHNLAV